MKNRIKEIGVLAVCVASMSSAPAPVPDDDCLPEGEVTEVPANPDLSSPGVPVGAQPTSDPRWFDEDLFSDDYLGAGDPLELENKNGNISGPNGEVANGGLDGDCIELYYMLKLRYQITVQVCQTDRSTLGAGGSGISSGSSDCRIVKVWHESWFKFTVGEKCPC
jgi:hypothetical protein